MNSIIHQNGRSILGAGDATHHLPVVLVAVVRAWADVHAGEDQVVGIVNNVPRSGPILPVGITIADRRTIHVPGIDKIIRIRS